MAKGIKLYSNIGWRLPNLNYATVKGVNFPNICFTNAKTDHLGKRRANL